MAESSALATALSKAARRLVPFMGLLFLVSFLDRANVSFAALAMNKDLGFTPTIYAWGVGFFFFGYVLFEVPSNMVVMKTGVRRWMAVIIVAWGFASVLMALTEGQNSFFVLRFLLGAAEAGFLPGMLLYLTFWFPARKRARMTALFMIAIPLSNVVGAPLSGWILGIDSLAGLWGFKTWQWLFIIEGIPAVLLGVMVLWVLTDRPSEAQWLSDAERAAIAETLAHEAEAQAAGGHQLGTSLRHGLFSAPILMLCLAYFGMLLGGFGIIFWVPQIVKAFGLSNLETGFVAAIPYAVSSVAMLVLGRIGDHTGKRIPLVVGPALAGALGLVVAGLSTSPVLSVAALSLAACGIYGSLPAFWTLPTAYARGTAAAGAFAMVNSIGAMGGFVGPYIIGWVKEETGAFGPGLVVLGCGALVSALVVLALSKLHSRPGH
jgi:ACS family tartrate transporter-like MFS transporter